MMIDWDALLAILIVTLGTYAFKLSGLLLSDRIAKEGNMRIFLDSLPASLLVSLIAPSVFREGILGIAAALLLVWSLSKTNNPLAAMVIGIVSIAIGRQFMS